jgi:hypothetical protein
MDRNHKNAGILLMVIMAAVVMLVVGCSTENSPLGPVASPSNSQPNSGAVSQYPPLTDEMLANLPGGLRALSLGATAVDGWCDTVQTARWCRDDHDNTVSLLNLVSINIPRGALSEDEIVTIVAPNSCVAVADFYPHPYLFNSTVEITWNIGMMHLPRNYDYSQIVPWYVTDAGEYIPLQYHWEHGHDYLVVYTNHFSRYILGGPAEN